MDYTKSIDKATKLLQELEIDDALSVFYQLLKAHPNDLQLIDRIYSLEVKRPTQPGFEKICQHVFGLTSSRSEYQEYVVRAFGDYLRLTQNLPEVEDKKLFNLFYRLGLSHFTEQLKIYNERIKSEYADDSRTPEALKLYCEQLIKQKKLIRARDELKYIIAYYAETPAGQWSLEQRKRLEMLIIK
ncbi:MAG: hypothetical protein OQJ89_13855 [Kangiellaceae bacterium]|nr:hypothetical protein [Kangiellaceae bacterium]MCW9018050.1 hypothetical protein [Kangiellaceae bacterium]